SDCPKRGRTRSVVPTPSTPSRPLQSEYSLWTRDPEDGVLAVVRELGIGFVAYSPLGHGFLSGQIRTTDDFADDDWRKTNPRFMGENFERNLRIADEVASVAADAEATPAQITLAWLLSKGDDIVPIPGTKRTARVEENCAADGIELSPEQIHRLDNLAPAAGGHHNEEQMRLLQRCLSLSRSQVSTRSRRHLLEVDSQVPITANNCHSPGTPFSLCEPRSSNAMPEPATRSFTVPDTRTWSASASAATRAPMWTAMPPTWSPMSSISPVWIPAR